MLLFLLWFCCFWIFRHSFSKHVLINSCLEWFGSKNYIQISKMLSVKIKVNMIVSILPFPSSFLILDPLTLWLLRKYYSNDLVLKFMMDSKVTLFSDSLDLFLNSIEEYRSIVFTYNKYEFVFCILMPYHKCRMLIQNNLSLVHLRIFWNSFSSKLFPKTCAQSIVFTICFLKKVLWVWQGFRKPYTLFLLRGILTTEY